jgi:hypothetical protein
MPNTDDTAPETLDVVARTDEHDGYVTFGVMYQGAFVPLSGVKTGHVAAFVNQAKEAAAAESESGK